MSSKALRKQLLAAVAMVIVAAIAVTSSTFAWFAANTEVTATGMEVTAKSDTTFLLIKAGTATAAAVRNDNKTLDNALTASAALYPSAHKNITVGSDTVTTGTATISTIEAHANNSDPTPVDVLTNWYYRNIDDPRYATEAAATAASVTAHETADKEIANADLGKYILVNEFTLALAEGSNNIENLKVGTCTITTAGDQAVKVLVATNSACEEFGGTGGTGHVVLRSTNLTAGASDIETVRIYIYWDGTDTDVYTNGIADLKNTTVSVTFTGDVVTA